MDRELGGSPKGAAQETALSPSLPVPTNGEEAEPVKRGGLRLNPPPPPPYRTPEARGERSEGHLDPARTPRPHSSPPARTGAGSGRSGPRPRAPPGAGRRAGAPAGPEGRGPGRVGSPRRRRRRRRRHSKGRTSPAWSRPQLHSRPSSALWARARSGRGRSVGKPPCGGDPEGLTLAEGQIREETGPGARPGGEGGGSMGRSRAAGAARDSRGTRPHTGRVPPRDPRRVHPSRWRSELIGSEDDPWD